MRIKIPPTHMKIIKRLPNHRRRTKMTKCTPCRVRHLTCDQNSICTECAKSKRECIRGYNLRFRHLACPSITPTRADFGRYEFFFDGEQTWMESSGDGGKIDFVLEGEDALSGFCAVEGDVDVEGIGLLGGTDDTARTVDLSVRKGDSAAHVKDDKLLESVPLSKLDVLADQSLAQASLSEENFNTTSRPSDLQTPVSMAGPAWPVSSLREGRLLQHFITHLAPWFDVGDQKRHFGRHVPCMAASSPLLMTALLALAALHHSRTMGNGDLYEAMDYHNRCLSLMVSMLSDPNRVNDDSVLVATVILHLYEDLESGNDLTRHLKGTSLFFPSQTPTTPPTQSSSHLRRAVFWIYLEQEIYNAYIHHRSVRTNFSLTDIESYADGPNDDDRAYHHILHLAANVSKWAFSDDSPSQPQWRHLHQMIQDWEHSRPASFDPIYHRDRDRQGEKRCFPETCYLTAEATLASHFLHLSHLLLTTHDPTLPRIGPRVKSTTATMHAEALSHVRAMVGSAMCNSHVTARFTGSLAVILCSSWITDPLEQHALLDFLHETARCSGWPRDQARRALMEEWALGEE